MFIDFSYALTPFVAWFAAGTLKFIVNSAKAGQWAFGLIGYGGMPSTHSAIVSSTAALIGLREGLDHPAFGVAVTLAFVVMLDANSLRRQVGRHAEAINRIVRQAGSEGGAALRERMGHSPWEIAAGILVGVCVAALIHMGSA